MKKNVTIKFAITAICITIALVLPLFTAQVRELGNALCLIHIPIILCGFICSWQYGLIAGLATPFIRFAIFGMPQLIPNGISMALEMGIYGCICGLCYKLFPKKIGYIYLSLIISMISGRIVWGIARYIFAGVQGTKFPIELFISSGFIVAIPGIIIQLVAIPIIVFALRKADLIFNK